MTQECKWDFAIWDRELPKFSGTQNLWFWVQDRDIFQDFISLHTMVQVVQVQWYRMYMCVWICHYSQNY